MAATYGEVAVCPPPRGFPFVADHNEEYLAPPYIGASSLFPDS